MAFFWSKKEQDNTSEVVTNSNNSSDGKIIIEPAEKLKVVEYFTTNYAHPESVTNLILFKEDFIDFIVKKQLNLWNGKVKDLEKKTQEIQQKYNNVFEIVMLHKKWISISVYNIEHITEIRKYLIPFIKDYVTKINISTLKTYYQTLNNLGYNIKEDYLNDPSKLKEIAEMTAKISNNDNNWSQSSNQESVKEILSKPIELIYSFNIGYIFLSKKFFSELRVQVNEIYHNEKEIMEKLWTNWNIWIDWYLKKIKDKFQHWNYDEKELVEEAEKFVDVILNVLVKRYWASDIFFLPYSWTDRPTWRVLYKTLGKTKPFIDDIPWDFFIRLIRIIWLKANFEVKNDQYQFSGVIQSFPIDATRRVNFRTEVFQVLSKTHLWWPMPFSVLRTLEGWKSKTLEELNYTTEFITSIRALTRNNKQGIIIVSWPTGSGKSTLLYAVIAEYSVQMPDRLIYSIENPVEKDLNLWNFAQMEIDPAKGMEFKIWLKSLMRMAPDVIFVWEIRDKETAMAALEAANTWHLVFATLHVNNAIEIPTRLEDLIQDATKISELKTSLKGAVAQRLLPVLCEKCMQTEDDSLIFPDTLQKVRWVDYYEKLKDINQVNITWSGCSECKGMGTVWRLPVVEIIAYNKVLNNQKELYMYLKHTINFKSMFWYAVEQMRAWKKVDYKDVISMYDTITDVQNIDPKYV